MYVCETYFRFTAGFLTVNPQMKNTKLPGGSNKIFIIYCKYKVARSATPLTKASKQNKRLLVPVSNVTQER